MTDLGRTKPEAPPFTPEDVSDDPDTQRKALEYAARLVWRTLIAASIEDGHGKSYDPLRIWDDRECSSYVFELTPDGGRHHAYTSLAELADRVANEAAASICEHTEEGER